MKRYHRPRGEKKPIASVAAIVLALFCRDLAAFGYQNSSSTAPDEPIAEVRVAGNRNVTTQKIMAEIKTRAGVPPDRKLIEDDVRRLIATKQFFDIGVEYLHEPHGLVVLFRVLEGNQIREVVLEGNRAISSDKLRDKAGLNAGKDKSKDKKENTLDIARAKDAARTMEDFYHDKGYPFAQVVLVEGTQPGDKRLVFRITEGPKVAITDVDFEFLDHNTLGGRLLATKIKSKPRRFGFFGGRYNGRDVDDDVHRLTAYYRSLGFFDAKVSREIHESDDRSKVSVLFVVQEGPQYRVRSIDFTGNRKLDETKLLEGLKLQQGMPFHQQRLQADVQKLLDKYGAMGHIEAKVNPDVRYLDKPGEVDLVYQITEGEPFYVGRILINGNQTTKDNVIRSELRIYPGEPFDSTAMRRSEANLRRRQLFQTNIQAGTGPTLTPVGEGTRTREIELTQAVMGPETGQPGEGINMRDVIVNVEEAQTGRILFGIGVNSDAGLLGNIIISEQNFDLFRFPASFGDFLAGDAFRGGGQEFRLEAAPGTQLSRYLLSWRQPRLFDMPYSLGVSGYFFDRFYREYHEERTGAQITLGHEFTDQIRASLGIRLENVHISDPDIPTPPDLLKVLGDNFLAAVTAALEHDTRDNPFMPTTGHLAQVSFEEGLGDFTFPKLTLEGRQYWTVAERVDGSGKQVLSLRGTVGFAGDNTPIFERFYVGGFRNFRGFEFRGVGPTVFDTHVGGDFMLLGSLEYQVPITADDTLQAVVFSDFGTLEEDVRISEFRVTFGVGLRVVVPLLGPVPLAFDFAFPLHSADSDREQVFSFFIGFFR